MKINIDLEFAAIKKIKELIGLAIKKEYHSKLILTDDGHLYIHDKTPEPVIIAIIEKVKSNIYYEPSMLKKDKDFKSFAAEKLFISSSINVHRISNSIYDKNDIYDINASVFNFENKNKELENSTAIENILAAIFPNPYLQIESKNYQEFDNNFQTYYSFHIDLGFPKIVNIYCLDILNYYNDDLFKRSLAESINKIYKIDLTKEDITEKNIPNIILQIQALSY